jgi:hypothetical protein
MKIVIKNYISLAIKHSFVSIICATTEFSLFLLFFSILNISLTYSYILSFMAAFFIGLFGHSYLTFSLGNVAKRNLYLFLTQCIIALVLGYLLVHFFISINLSPSLSKILQLSIIFIFNLIFGKNFTFKKIINFED